MKRLSDISKLVPPELLVIGNIRDLLNKITELQQDIINANDASDSIIDDIELVLEQYKTLSDSLNDLLTSPSLDSLITVITLADDLSSAINLEQVAAKFNIFEHPSFMHAMQGIKRAKSILNEAREFTKAISELSEIAKDIKVSNEYETPIGDIDLGLSVGAQASIAINVLEADAIKEHLGIVNNSDNVMVNHQAIARLFAGAKASALIKSIQVSAGLQANAELEIDTYYQAPRHVQSYFALWSMFSSTPKLWQFKNVLDSLQYQDVQGYRAFSIKGKRKLSLWGSVSLGHSLVTQMDVNSREVGVDISAKASYTRKHSYEGDARLFITKDADQALQIKVEFDHKTVNSSNFAIGLNAEFTGLDRVAADYADIVLGKGDEIVASLEQFSTPGLSLSKAINEHLGQDQWYSPLSTLLLSEAQPDKSINQMLSSSLQLFFDRHFFAQSTDQSISADTLAASALDYLHEQFSPQTDTSFVTEAEAEQIKDMLKSRLVTLITAKQNALNDQATDFITQIKQKLTAQGEQALLPLYALGEDIQTKLKDVLDDANIVASKAQDMLSLAIKRYTAFKTRLQTIIEKSQNIKLAISHENSKTQLHSKALSFTLVFKKQSLSAQRLYQLLIIGADEHANLLMQSMLERQEIELTGRSERIKRTLSHTSTQTFAIFGFNSTQTRNTVNDLDIQVDASGNIKVIGSAAREAVAQGEFERREASANISYGFAQAALNEASNDQSQNTNSTADVSTNFDLSYLNQDKQTHTEQELKDLFDSLRLPNRDLSSLQTPLPEIISEQAIAGAMQTYIEHKAAYAVSSVSIQMRASEDIMRQMLALEGVAIFNVCADYLRAVFVDNERKDFANEFFEAFMERRPTNNNGKDSSQGAANAPAFSSYHNLYTHVSFQGQLGKIEKRTLLSKIKNLGIPEEPFFGIDRSPRESESAKKWNEALRQVSMIGQQAHTTMQLPDALNGIRSAIIQYTDLPDSQKVEGLKTLNKQLNRYNREISTAFEPWIEVESDLANRLKDLLSKRGIGIANINYRLLALFMSLSTLLEASSPLFTTTITLEGPNKPAKVILVN
jgi:hypothetical protein